MVPRSGRRGGARARADFEVRRAAPLGGLGRPLPGLLSLFLPIVLPVLLPFFACKRETRQASKAPLTILGVVSVRDLTPPGEAPAHLDIQDLERALRARLLATGQFAAGEPDAGAPNGITRVDVKAAVDGAEVADKGLARARVLVHFETRPEGVPGAIADELEGAGQQPYVVPRPSRRGATGPPALPKDALYNGLVQRIAGDLFDEFAARRRLRQGSPEALRAALASDGGELRRRASPHE
jgi:hypothetical protein